MENNRRPECRKPLVSVVVATRNRPELLRRALDSIAAQTYRELEVIVVDDASDEPAAAVFEDYRGKLPGLSFLANEVRCGGAESRNIGIRSAAGEYIAFLDDDDEWLPEKIYRQVRMLEESPALGAVTCWATHIFSGGAKKVAIIPEVTPDVMLWENFLGSFSLCMVRKSLALETPVDPMLPSCQDWYFWIELMNKRPVGIVKEHLVNYYEHPGQRIRNTYYNKVGGVRRFYFRYRHLMSEDCRVYFLTKLYFYRLLKNGLPFSRIPGIFLRKKFLLRERAALFVLKKMLFSGIDSVLGLHRYDAQAMTYSFYRKIHNMPQAGQ